MILRILTDFVSETTKPWRNSWNSATNYERMNQTASSLTQCHSNLIQIVCPIRQRTICIQHNAFNLITAGPLCIARVSVDSPNVLSNLRLNRFQQKVIDGIHRVREYQFGPDEDSKLVANRVEIVSPARN